MFIKSVICLAFLIVFAQSQIINRVERDFVPKRFNFQEKNKRVVAGYFPTWRETWNWREGKDQGTPMRNIPSDYNTIMLAFAKPNLRYTKGSLATYNIGLYVPYNGEGLRNSVETLKKKNITVLLSIGGERAWPQALYNPNAACYDIRYDQIKDLVDDMYLDGIEWEYIPDGFNHLIYPRHYNKQIELITKSREVMPKSEKYIIASVSSGVGAFGSSQYPALNDPNSRWNKDLGIAYGSGRANCHGREEYRVDVCAGSFWNHRATGHFVPVLLAVGDKLDLVNVQGYDVGGADRMWIYDSFKDYAFKKGFVIGFGISVGDEPFGPYFVWNFERVGFIMAYIINGGDKTMTDVPNKLDGITLWETQTEAFWGKSKGNNPFRFARYAHCVLNTPFTPFETCLKEAKAMQVPATPRPWWMR